MCIVMLEMVADIFFFNLFFINVFFKTFQIILFSFLQKSEHFNPEL